MAQLPAEELMYQRILVPVDGSETAWRGLEEAIALATTLKSAIRLIHVSPHTPYSGQR